ncbi:hypothetical protein SNEBB_006591 [Seison nebaliae]|nr:hypothetical protein SNEBB_006591 [Seison nebaliae]
MGVLEDVLDNDDEMEVVAKPVVVDKRFEYTKTGNLGNKRESMLRNEVLRLPRLGKSLRSANNLPHIEYTYGKPVNYYGGGVAEALVYTNLEKLDKPKKFPIPSSKYNRIAIKHQATTASNNMRIRRIFHKFEIRDPKKSKKSSIPDMVFGRPPWPETDFSALIEQRYGAAWREKQTKIAIQIDEQMKSLKSSHKDLLSRQTRTQILRMHRSKFQPRNRQDIVVLKHNQHSNVQSKINSYRDEELKAKMMNKHKITKFIPEVYFEHDKKLLPPISNRVDK